MATRQGSRCVFVGNIPYDATEDQLRDIFTEAGPVVNFRLVYDRDTGKPKGYGFCEFRDAETASSAMRNLNGRDMNGRALRVDYAENEKGSAEGAKWDQEPVEHPKPMQEVPVPPKPDVPLKTIPATVSSMSTTQLYDVMWSMKNLINTNIEQARKILKNNPSFAYAILQAQVVLGLADANAIQQALIQSLPPQPQIMTPLHVNPALQANRFPIPNQTFPNNQYPIPNLQPGAYQQSNPRPAAPAAFPGFPGTAVPVDLQDILAQLMHLTPQQMEELTPDQRETLNQIRMAMVNGNAR